MTGDRGFRQLAEGATLPPLDVTQWSRNVEDLTVNNPDLETGAVDEFDCS